MTREQIKENQRVIEGSRDIEPVEITREQWQRVSAILKKNNVESAGAVFGESYEKAGIVGVRQKYDELIQKESLSVSELALMRALKLWCADTNYYYLYLKDYG